MSVRKDLWRKNLPYFDPIYLNDTHVIAIACPTEQDAIALFDILDEYGYRWAGTGEKLSPDNLNWSSNKSDTCYYLNYRGASKGIVYGDSEPEKQHQWYQFSASYIHQSCKIDIMDMV